MMIFIILKIQKHQKNQKKQKIILSKDLKFLRKLLLCFLLFYHLQYRHIFIGKTGRKYLNQILYLVIL